MFLGFVVFGCDFGVILVFCGWISVITVVGCCRCLSVAMDVVVAFVLLAVMLVFGGCCGG